MVHKVFLFTALACEAKPFIQQLKLKKYPPAHAFAIYTNHDWVLTVSGSGKTAMAAAVAYSLALFAHAPNPLLFNLGIAGHQSAELGQLFAAHKITDTDSGRSFYPPLLTDLPCATQAIYTVSKPETCYTDDCLYEMEASSFYETACRFSTGELIQCYKVISDNQHCGIANIEAAWVTKAMASHVDSIISAIDNLLKLAAELESPAIRYYEQILKQWHFSVSGEIKLKSLLQRWQVLTDDVELDCLALSFNSSKAVLHWLEQQVEAVAYVEYS